ncbi:MAG: 50S ribosomal protein L30e [Candidatus Methanofastidiosia archaeon]
MDIAREIRKAIDTGKVVLGTDRSIKALKAGDSKLIIYAANTKKETKEDLQHYAKISNVPILEYKGTGVDIGMVCGKPFIVSMLSINSPGESIILSAEGE